MLATNKLRKILLAMGAVLALIVAQAQAQIICPAPGVKVFGLSGVPSCVNPNTSARLIDGTLIHQLAEIYATEGPIWKINASDAPLKAEVTVVGKVLTIPDTFSIGGAPQGSVTMTIFGSSILGNDGEARSEMDAQNLDRMFDVNATGRDRCLAGGVRDLSHPVGGHCSPIQNGAVRSVFSSVESLARDPAQHQVMVNNYFRTVAQVYGFHKEMLPATFLSDIGFGRGPGLDVDNVTPAQPTTQQIAFQVAQILDGVAATDPVAAEAARVVALTQLAQLGREGAAQASFEAVLEANPEVSNSIIAAINLYPGYAGGTFKTAGHRYQDAAGVRYLIPDIEVVLELSENVVEGTVTSCHPGNVAAGIPPSFVMDDMMMIMNQDPRFGAEVLGVIETPVPGDLICDINNTVVASIGHTVGEHVNFVQEVLTEIVHFNGPVEIVTDRHLITDRVGDANGETLSIRAIGMVDKPQNLQGDLNTKLSLTVGSVGADGEYTACVDPTLPRPIGVVLQVDPFAPVGTLAEPNATGSFVVRGRGDIHISNDAEVSQCGSATHMQVCGVENGTFTAFGTLACSEPGLFEVDTLVPLEIVADAVALDPAGAALAINEALTIVTAAAAAVNVAVPAEAAAANAALTIAIADATDVGATPGAITAAQVLPVVPAVTLQEPVQSVAGLSISAAEWIPGTRWEVQGNVTQADGSTDAGAFVIANLVKANGERIKIGSATCQNFVAGGPIPGYDIVHDSPFNPVTLANVDLVNDHVEVIGSSSDGQQTFISRTAINLPPEPIAHVGTQVVIESVEIIADTRLVIRGFASLNAGSAAGTAVITTNQSQQSFSVPLTEQPDPLAGGFDFDLRPIVGTGDFIHGETLTVTVAGVGSTSVLIDLAPETVLAVAVADPAVITALEATAAFVAAQGAADVAAQVAATTGTQADITAAAQAATAAAVAGNAALAVTVVTPEPVAAPAAAPPVVAALTVAAAEWIQGDRWIVEGDLTQADGITTDVGAFVIAELVKADGTRIEIGRATVDILPVPGFDIVNRPITPASLDNVDVANDTVEVSAISSDGLVQFRSVAFINAPPAPLPFVGTEVVIEAVEIIADNRVIIHGFASLDGVAATGTAVITTAGGLEFQAPLDVGPNPPAGGFDFVLRPIVGNGGFIQGETVTVTVAGSGFATTLVDLTPEAPIVPAVATDAVIATLEATVAGLADAAATAETAALQAAAAEADATAAANAATAATATAGPPASVQASGLPAQAALRGSSLFWFPLP